MTSLIPDLSPIIKLMFEKTGITFTADKFYIIHTKIQPLISKHGFPSIEPLLQSVINRNNISLITDIIDALTVHETSFYRDIYPFEILKNEIITEILKESKTRSEINILCAACSTGQEPYSLAINLNETTSRNFDFKISALDISKASIEKAKIGVYNQFEVQRGLPTHILLKYFDQVDKLWSIKDLLRRNVIFHQANLMDGLAFLGKFDVIFCRNVMMYFDEAQKKIIIENLKRILKPKGFLFLGATEILPRDEKMFTHWGTRGGIYRLI